MIAPQQGASYDEQLDAALATEAAGFSDFVRSDHYLAFDSTGLPGPTDSWITLAGLGARDAAGAPRHDGERGDVPVSRDRSPSRSRRSTP